MSTHPELICDDPTGRYGLLVVAIEERVRYLLWLGMGRDEALDEIVKFIKAATDPAIPTGVWTPATHETAVALCTRVARAALAFETIDSRIFVK